MQLEKVTYSDLNARQKENFNFQKISAVLAEYGFVPFRLSDDWQGADFVALHIRGDVLRVQLKSRLAFKKCYEGKDLHVAFPHDGDWYFFPHDKVLSMLLTAKSIGSSESWKEKGGYSFPRLSKEHRKLLEPYKITGDTKAVPD